VPQKWERQNSGRIQNGKIYQTKKSTGISRCAWKFPAASVAIAVSPVRISCLRYAARDVHGLDAHDFVDIEEGFDDALDLGDADKVVGGDLAAEVGVSSMSASAMLMTSRRRRR